MYMPFEPSEVRVATVSEKSRKNEFFSRSGKSQWILHLVREIYIILDIMSTKSQEQRKGIENEESVLNV